MDLEDAAVEIGHAADDRLQVGIMVRLAQPVVEQPQQEIAIEAVEPVLAIGRPHGRQPVAQVVGVAVQEALLLDEVDEHQPVEHYRDIPALTYGRSGMPVMNFAKASRSFLKRS